ncbi:hypothetical protein LAV73_21755 [Lysinibacillus xylanilyticus]|uniref:hypothetical protein n=1 Tax=Lysinibacillus xylanilyticus TaxID=582475 RepID=UPI002B24231B|nr:hypothetical protein [Lysinibacillus xylanilyticus]MEB2282558.1 hypothetical protein [Lysinibacillus xylanilyticus]
MYKAILGLHERLLSSFNKMFSFESEATATNVLTVRKRSDSNKCFNCAKAKRQQQMF